MKIFCPESHTPENLSRQIGELYCNFPDAFLVGSLGRSAVYNLLNGNPLTEFDARGQTVLLDGDNEPRDIDVIDVESTYADGALPFPVDTVSYAGPKASLTRDGSDWVLEAGGGAFCEAVHPFVMEPVHAETVYGIACNTVPLQTHLALLRVSGQFRPKDVPTYSLLSAFRSRSTSRSLPPELYEPFEKVHAINRDAFSHLVTF